MTATLWGLTVGDLFRSRAYGTARTFRVQSIHEADHAIPIDGTPRHYAMVKCEMLADPECGHPRETVWINTLESDGEPLEMGGWGQWTAVPIRVVQRAAPPAPRLVQLDLFGVQP